MRSASPNEVFRVLGLSMLMRNIIISNRIDTAREKGMRESNYLRHRAAATRVRLPAWALCSTLALATSVSAEQTIVLDTLVVTASGHAQSVESAPASITVIDRRQLEQQQYRDVTDALRSVPGVVVTGGGAGDRGADVAMRGMPAQYTLILVDGKRVSSRESRPNGSAGFEQDWLPPLQAIERIEVVRGPMSTLYGSDAIGGVVNIITRKVTDAWHGSVQLETTLQEDDDSGDSRSANFNLSGPLVEDRLGLQLYGRVSSRDEDDILYGYEDRNLRSGTAKLWFTPGEDHDFGIEAGQTEQTRRSHMGRTAPTEGCRGGCTDSIGDYDREHFAVSHTGRWEIGTSDTHLQREVATNHVREIEITNTTAKTSLVAPLGAHILTFGADYEHEELSDALSNQISDRTQIETSKRAVFAEDEWMLTDSFSLTGGMRVDDDDNFGSHLSPRLYGVWGFAPRWTLKGGVSTGYRSPGLRELTADWGQSSRGGDVYGNPNLQPETSLNKELALLFRSSNRSYGSVTLFHNEFEDKITRIACPISICPAGPNQFGSLPTYRVNIDEAVTRGVELGAGIGLGTDVDLSASYTYTDSEQKTGEYAGQPLLQLPKHLLNARLDWQASERLTPWARVTYRGEESQPVEGPSQTSIVAPSHTYVDLGLGYKLSPTLTLSGGLYNVLDKEIAYDEYGYVEDGRRLWLSVAAQF